MRPRLPVPPMPSLRIPGGGLTLRLASAAVGMPIVVAAIVIGGPLFTALLTLSLVVGLAEAAHMARIRRRSPVVLVGAAAIGSVLGAAIDGGIPITWPLLAGMLGVTAAATLSALRNESEPDPKRLLRYVVSGLVVLAALLYLALPGAAFVAVRQGPQGLDWMLCAVLAVMSTDAAAYAGGRTLGRRRLAPAISPNKTVEGAICGWLGGFGALLALDAIFQLDATLWPLIILAAALPIAAQLGDLTESLFKRAMNVKDSSNLIPGHGGVLDRLDSLLFGVPTVFFFLQWTS